MTGLVTSGHSQENQFISKVFDYVPAPGQFINTPIGSNAGAKSLAGKVGGAVSLGAFGGYIVVGFDKPVENDPVNPYGIDFTVFGNASQNSSEPANVFVMKDENGNGLPDDTWYLLAGSDYWFESTITNYKITYHNPKMNKAADVPWTDNQNGSGVVTANTYHTQPYYPLADSFPDINQDNYTLEGPKIADRLDNSRTEYIVSQKYPFGYADNLPRMMTKEGWEPDNPYTFDIEGAGGDAFDISWAIDSQDNYVNLDKIDFIKIQTAVNSSAGWLGELSTEITGIVDVAPDTCIYGEKRLMVIQPVQKEIALGNTVKLKAIAFMSGIKQLNAGITWSSTNEGVATVDIDGNLEAWSAGETMVVATWNEQSGINDTIHIKVQNPAGIKPTVKITTPLFANPVNQVINLQTPNGFSQFRIFNAMGITETQGNIFDNSINVNNLKSGYYIIQLSGSSQTVSQKFYKL